jgi:DNA-binding NarL/FixJ family response regulator
MQQNVNDNFSEDQSLRVLVVDDHLLIGETIVRSFERVPGFDVFAVGDVKAAIAQIKESGRFDVILLDYDIPGEEPMAAMTLLIKENSGGVALFSGVAKWSVVDRAMDLGAIGFIPKTAALSTLRHAISLIASGVPYLPIEYLRRNSSVGDSGIDFKPIEVGILKRLCQGLANKEIGRELDLNEITVKMHVRSLFSKLGVTNRTQVVLAAQKLGYCE